MIQKSILFCSQTHFSTKTLTVGNLRSLNLGRDKQMMSILMGVTLRVAWQRVKRFYGSSKKSSKPELWAWTSRRFQKLLRPEIKFHFLVFKRRQGLLFISAPRGEVMLSCWLYSQSSLMSLSGNEQFFPRAYIDSVEAKSCWQPSILQRR
jgi:hypothetical protein